MPRTTPSCTWVNTAPNPALRSALAASAEGSNTAAADVSGRTASFQPYAPFLSLRSWGVRDQPALWASGVPRSLWMSTNEGYRWSPVMSRRIAGPSNVVVAEGPAATMRPRCKMTVPSSRVVSLSRCTVACSRTVATSALSWVPLTGKVGSVVWAWRLVTETMAVHAPTTLTHSRLEKCRIRGGSIQNQVRRVPKKVMPGSVKVHRMVGATQGQVYLCPRWLLHAFPPASTLK